MLEDQFAGDIKSKLRVRPRVDYSENNRQRKMTNTPPLDMTIDRDGDDVGSNSGTPTEEEFQVLKEKLAAAKATQAERVRREEYAAMLKELAEVEGSATVGKKKKTKDTVNTKTLRDNSSVQKHVDELMGATVGAKFRGTTEDSDSSSESSSSSNSSSSDSESSDDHRRKKSSKKKIRHKEKCRARSGSRRRSKKKHASGKDRKSSSKVLYPQEWPHNHLGQHLATKERKYEQLSMAEFCAGYAAIMEDVLDRREAKYRLRHFKDLMYFATRFSWTSVLTFHSACLYEIERGTKTWKSSFHKLESTTLLPLSVSRKGATSKPTQGGPILYCGAFQKGECSHTKDHEGQFKGESRTLKHNCAKCWLNDKKFATHPQTACPSNDKEEED